MDVTNSKVRGEPYIPMEAYVKTPAWKSLRAGDKWLMIGSRMSIIPSVGLLFTHQFFNGNNPGDFKTANFKVLDYDEKANNMMCEFLGWQK